MKPKQPIETLILNIRSQKVILDADWSRLCGLTSRRLHEQVNRNLDRFAVDFMVHLTALEWDNLKSQFATSSLEGAQKQVLAPDPAQL